MTDPYGVWKDDLQKRQKIYRQAVTKALDLPSDEDDMQIHVDKSIKRGFGWRELSIVALLIAGSTLGTAYMLQEIIAPMSVPPTDSDYEVRFYDANGNPIEVPHISERLDSTTDE